MDAHDFIGQVLLFILTGLACLMGIAACLVAFGKTIESIVEFREKDLDVIGSHLVNEKGEWDFSRVEHLTVHGSPREYRDTAPIDDGMDKVEYEKDEEGNPKAAIREAFGEPAKTAQTIDLEI